MERRTIKNTYHTDFPCFLDLVEEPALNFVFNSEPLPLYWSATDSDVWSPLRITSGTTRPQSQCKNGQLSSQACLNISSQPKLLALRYVDSTYGSQASSDVLSVDGSSCPRESARSPSVTSSSCAHLSDHLRLNLALSADTDESLACHLCPWVGNTPSEKRKHDARHRKAHKCEICNASFGTQNDLERHRKARHQKNPRCGPSERFKCFGRGCTNPDKLWPRRDNFKAHIQRKHKYQDEKELMRLSREWYERNKYICTEEETKVEETYKNGNNESTELDKVDDGFISRKRLKDETAFIAIPEETPKPTNNSPEPVASNPVDPVSNVKLPGVESVFNSSNNLQELDTVEEQAGALPSMRSLERGVALMEALALKKLEKQDSHVQQHRTIAETNVLSASQPTGLHRKPLVNLPSLQDFSENERVFLLNLVSDMKKHTARHEKRYGCTFTECFRVFGSKADWKRHENTQHFHSRSFRCFLLGENGNECAQLFFREEKYREHLMDSHAVVDTDQINDHVSKNQIGKNGQTQYWCGFCRQIRRLKAKGLDAWKERFDHIDSEHFRKGQRIGDWLPPSGHMVKRDLEIQRRETWKKRNAQLASDVHVETDSVLSGETFAKGERDQSEGVPCRENPADMSDDSSDFDSASEMADTFDDADSRNIRHSPLVYPEDSRKRKARDVTIYCCNCGDGPANGATNIHCANCGLAFCFSCKVETVAI
ncbi:Zinc finger protein 865 [Talaromyces islandicus]|uniref:Zinc finger protein 865 n=1 Tax=Talaromyces islandicus TaxID=28573 RepID=A0A0U1MB23_TALIS|nr:Zinc finger protein 865 [Talaromyces islandicus]